ncbi:MAG: 3-deoxy-D-manno-octulosonic acid transferase [Planctomycetes bacterium]|nr:3-deoxy-D-manno-octulosonic acid transferase [Planctomycetota bacterium]
MPRRELSAAQERQRSAAAAPARRPPVSRVLLSVYNVVFFFVFLAYLPLFLWRMIGDRSYRRGLLERTGRVTPSASTDVLWIHGVSVGEVKAAAPLVALLQRVASHVEIVISVTTPTGANVARSLFPDHRVIFYPLDFGFFPARSLDRIRPRAVLLMELELWPNFLHAAERRGIPIIVVNGRISERSFKGYRRVSWLLPQLDRIDLFAVQNETYAARLRALGVAPERIRITGNMKYDSLEIAEEGVPRDREFDRWLNLAPGERVVVVGSTHDNEEERFARVLLEVEAALGATLRLLVTPRHPERAAAATDDIVRVIEEARADHRVHRLTELRTSKREHASARSWIVVDTIGELEKAYSVADVVFVGGSLVPHGGQNMLEPVALGKPTIVGPHVQNFADDVRTLLEERGLIKVDGERELKDRLLALLRHPEAGAELVRSGLRVLAAGRGATQRTYDNVQEILLRCGVAVLDGAAPSDGLASDEAARA